MRNKKWSLSLFLIILLLNKNAFPGNSSSANLKGYKSTMNFCVWAPTQNDAEKISAAIEDYYKKFLKDLKYGGMLKKKPEVYIFKNYEEYISEVGVENINTGGLAHPHSAREAAKVYSFLSPYLIESVLPHELTHLLFREITTGLKTDAHIPLWLNEGMASFEESSRHYKEEVSLAFKKGGIIPVEELVSLKQYPEDMAKNSLFYAESASLVDFLINSYGGQKFLSFSEKLIRGGKDISEALRDVYYPDIKDVSGLSKAWVKFQNK